MKRIIIVAAATAFDFEKKQFTIGGVQTYIQDLLNLELRYQCRTSLVVISPKAVDSSDCIWNGHKIEVICQLSSNLKKANQKGFELAYNKYNSDQTVFIISTDQMDIKSRQKNVISIQHGIAFDGEGLGLGFPWNLSDWTKRLYMHIRACVNVSRYRHTPNFVCVDYNFFNWVRTLGQITGRTNTSIVLNHTSKLPDEGEIITKLNTKRHRLKIIFARRFYEYRGALVFANVVEKLLSEGYAIDVTFAGTGPLADTLMHKFQGCQQISFINYNPEDSVDIHYGYDIAVVPTLRSEGSSLSLAEAMAAGCLPVVSHVGGMTNMLIDGYNGLFAYPSEEGFYKVLKKALDMSPERRREIAMNAYKVAKNALSLEKWESAWAEVLEIDDNTSANDF